MSINAKTNLVEWVRQRDAERLRNEVCDISPLALDDNYYSPMPELQRDAEEARIKAKVLEQQRALAAAKRDTLATMKMTKIKPSPKHAALQAQLRDADALKKQYMRQPDIGAGQRAWDHLRNEVRKRRVDEMMLSPLMVVNSGELDFSVAELSPGKIWHVKPLVTDDTGLTEAQVALRSEVWKSDPITYEDYMGLLALELKQALCPAPAPPEVQPPKRAPRVHGIGTVAAMGHRMGAGFGGDPDL
jgi:hypothetical protein